ncbi:PEP-CTERM putative exosortase interaction domain-containing protein [Nostoc sp. PCC 7524]|uniref:PEP-CTERM sorting domain-containing protein n=1 Tax=Nostoc sp. (strain ATCC 29411 / PCC 7524) TaxID=28072 RepID=UPI00029F2096|nr:PEP-CTERM sorting domain-containing protein [Nostoc sp. PCC 7524]AFY47750.1 PEP-CTERM putative exosortase interaction domain-containing protein [Nostoc sp. PCC 7524]
MQRLYFIWCNFIENWYQNLFILTHSPTNISSGFWDTLGIANGSGNAGPGLSHIDIYTSTPIDTTTPVPEPITMFGLGVGIAGGGLLKQKYGKKPNKEKATV